MANKENIKDYLKKIAKDQAEAKKQVVDKANAKGKHVHNHVDGLLGKLMGGFTPEEIDTADPDKLLQITAMTSLVLGKMIAGLIEDQDYIKAQLVTLQDAMKIRRYCTDYNGTELAAGDYLKVADGKKKVLDVYNDAVKLSECDKFDEEDGIWPQKTIKTREWVKINHKEKK